MRGIVGTKVGIREVGITSIYSLLFAKRYDLRFTLMRTMKLVSSIGQPLKIIKICKVNQVKIAFHPIPCPNIEMLTSL